MQPRVSSTSCQALLRRLEDASGDNWESLDPAIRESCDCPWCGSSGLRLRQCYKILRSPPWRRLHCAPTSNRNLRCRQHMIGAPTALAKQLAVRL